MAAKTAQVKKAAPRRGALTRHAVRAMVFGPIEKKAPSKTGKPKAGADDGILAMGMDLIEPPFDPLGLTMLPEEGSLLGMCIEAMGTNIERFGHAFRCEVNVEAPETTEDLKAKVRTEFARCTTFFDNCALEGTFLDIRDKRRKDMEGVGWGTWELITGPFSGDVQFLNYVQAHRVRLAKQDEEVVRTMRPFIYHRPDGGREIRQIPVRRRFRRFAVLPPDGGSGKIVWFKEFGDPRVLDSETGKFESVENPVPIDRRANELIYHCIHSARTPYGVPRYAGLILTIRAERAGEEINYTTLLNNNVPSLIIMVSNGQLTGKSIERVKQFIQQVRSSKNMSRILLLEAERGDRDGADIGTMKIDIEKLVNEQMRDQLFERYGKNNRQKIREAFRISSIYLGGEDFTQGTAGESKRTTDEQVFAPERASFDAWVNQYLLPRMGIVYHKFVSLGPNVTDTKTIADLMMVMERTGGMTPALSTQLGSETIGQKLSEATGIDKNIPFSIQMAEKVKNQADMEVGAQVTALKRASGPDGVGEHIEGLFKWRETLEASIDARHAEESIRERVENERVKSEQRPAGQGPDDIGN